LTYVKKPANLLFGIVFSCENVNECLASETPCTGQSECVDTDGSYYCKCASGYRVTDNKATCEGKLQIL